MRLSKSDYMRYLLAPALLWLKKHDADRLPAFDESAEFRARQGDAVEAIARQSFPQGVLVETRLEEAVADTNKLVEEGVKVIFQASVLTERGLFCMADVLVANWDGSWDIYEVKSTASVKSEHIDDLAFQKLAFQEAGYRIGRTHLVHINTGYTRQGAIDPARFLTATDVTDAVDGHLQVTARQIKQAFKVIRLPSCPDDHPVNCGNIYRWMDVYRHLHPNLPDDSIYNLCRLSLKTLKRLHKLGVDKIGDIPASFRLGPHQKAQVKAVQTGSVTAHPLKIAHQLAKLAYPLYFLDYETTFAAIPLWDGTRPYQQIPFQYSLYIVDAPGTAPRHKEYLATGSQYPVPALTARLAQDIGPAGSVIAWNKYFEMGINQYLAYAAPEHKDFLKKLNRRMFDLMDPFAQLLYVDHRFLGSASIKKVLPVIVPELGYQDLAISEGGAASLRWYKIAKGDITGPATGKIYADLRKYCRMDTLAMVKIHQFLTDLTKDTAQAPTALPF